MVIGGLTTSGSGAADSGKTRFNIKRVMCNRLASTVLKILDSHAAVIAQMRDSVPIKRPLLRRSLATLLWEAPTTKVIDTLPNNSRLQLCADVSIAIAYCDIMW